MADRVVGEAWRVVDETNEVHIADVRQNGEWYIATLRGGMGVGTGLTARLAVTRAGQRYGVAEVLAPGVETRAEVLARLGRERTREIAHQRVQREVAVAHETARCIGVCQSLVERLGAVLTMGQRAAVMLAAWEMRPKGRRSET
jgi:hypothetical protein